MKKAPQRDAEGLKPVLTGLGGVIGRELPQYSAIVGESCGLCFAGFTRCGYRLPVHRRSYLRINSFALLALRYFAY